MNEHDSMNAHDSMLETLVAVANLQEGDFALGLTLSVHGAILGGLLVPAIRWMKDCEDLLVSNAPPAEPNGIAGHGLAAMFTGFRQHLSEVGTEDRALQRALDDLEAEEKLPARYAGIVREEQRPTYIHLRHAKYWQPGADSMPAEDGMLWRGRLSQVDGWSLGHFGPAPTSN